MVRKGITARETCSIQITRSPGSIPTRNYTYALATMDDGFYATGDSGKANILLNHTLNLGGDTLLMLTIRQILCSPKREIGVVADSSTIPEPALWPRSLQA